MSGYLGLGGITSHLPLQHHTGILLTVTSSTQKNSWRVTAVCSGPHYANYILLLYFGGGLWWLWNGCQRVASVWPYSF